MRQEGRIQHPKKVNWSALNIPKYTPYGRKAEATFYLREAAKTQPSLMRLAENPNIGFDSLTFAPNEDPGELYAACAMAAMITPKLPNILGSPCDEAEAERRMEMLSKLINGYLIAISETPWLDGAKIGNAFSTKMITTLVLLISIKYTAYGIEFNRLLPQNKGIAEKFNISEKDVYRRTSKDLKFIISSGISHSICDTFAGSSHLIAKYLGTESERSLVNLWGNNFHAMTNIGRFSDEGDVPFYADAYVLRRNLNKWWGINGPQDTNGRLVHILENCRQHIFSEYDGVPNVFNLVFNFKMIENASLKPDRGILIPDLRAHGGAIDAIGVGFAPHIYRFCDVVRKGVERLPLFVNGLTEKEAEELIIANGGGALPTTKCAFAQEQSKRSSASLPRR